MTPLTILLTCLLAVPAVTASAPPHLPRLDPVQTVLSTFADKHPYGSLTPDDFVAFDGFRHALNQLGCSTTHPCPVHVTHDDAGMARLTNGLARLAVIFGNLTSQYDVAKQIRLHTQLVFPTIHQIMMTNFYYTYGLTEYKKGPAYINAIFARLRDMAGCVQGDVAGPCFTTPIEHPFEWLKPIYYNQDYLFAWPIQHFPWTGDFVRVRGDALRGLQRYSHDSYSNSYPAFRAWLARQRSLPLPQEVPFESTKTPIYLPNDMSRLVGSYLDVKSRLALQHAAGHSSPDTPVSVMNAREVKDLWVLNQIAASGPGPNFEYSDAQGMTEWMKDNGYSEANPVVVDRTRFAQYEAAIHKYASKPWDVGYMIKMKPELFYRIVSRTTDNWVRHLDVISRILLPVQPGQPPSIIDTFGPRDAKWHIELFADKLSHPYVVFTKKARAELIGAANGMLADNNINKLYRPWAKAVLEWLHSEEYARMYQLYVKGRK